MQLEKRLEFEKATMKGYDELIVEKGIRTTITVEAKLTPVLAGILECRDKIYTANGVPQDWFDTGLPLTVEAKDIALQLPCPTAPDVFDEVVSELAYKFKVLRVKDGLCVSFIVHILDTTFDFRSFLRWARSLEKREFSMIVKPRQGDLFDGEPAGTRMEATGGDINPVVALPSAREMGGTHQKKGKSRRLVVAGAQAEAAEEHEEPVVN